MHSHKGFFATHERVCVCVEGGFSSLWFSAVAHFFAIFPLKSFVIFSNLTFDLASIDIFQLNADMGCFFRCICVDILG